MIGENVPPGTRVVFGNRKRLRGTIVTKAERDPRWQNRSGDRKRSRPLYVVRWDGQTHDNRAWPSSLELISGARPVDPPEPCCRRHQAIFHYGNLGVTNSPD